jgi:hypothetical protein
MRLDCLPPLAPVTPVLFLPGAPRYHLASNVPRACIVIQLGLRSRQAFAVQARSLAVVRTRRSARLVWLEGTAIRVVLLLLLEIVNQDRTLRAVQTPLPVCLALPACTAMERGCPRQRLNVLRAHTRRLRGYLSATCEATLPLVATGTRTLLLQMFLYSLRLASIKAAGSSFLAVGRLLPILLTVAMLLLLSVGVVECLWLDLVVQCVSMVPMLCLRML